MVLIQKANFGAISDIICYIYNTLVKQFFSAYPLEDFDTVILSYHCLYDLRCSWRPKSHIISAARITKGGLEIFKSGLKEGTIFCPVKGTS